MTSSAIPILTYHSLDVSGSVVSTAPTTFKWQMEYLWRNGYRTLSLSELSTLIRMNKPCPGKACVITFDDGYRNVYTQAFPLLQAHSFTATVFLVTDYCAKDNNWPGHVSPVGRQPLLSWTEITEMAKYGVEFGSHTLTHPDLTTVSRQEAERQMSVSKRVIEDRLGKNVRVFAYPYGRYTSWVIDMARAHFIGACSTRLGKTTAGCDPYLLPRIDMYYLSRKPFVRALETRRLDWYLGLRQALRTILRHDGAKECV